MKAILSAFPDISRSACEAGAASNILLFRRRRTKAKREFAECPLYRDSQLSKFRYETDGNRLILAGYKACKRPYCRAAASYHSSPPTGTT